MADVGTWCFECHHSYANHEWKEGRCRNGNCDCPEYERDPAPVAERCAECGDGKGWYVVPNRNTGDAEQQQCRTCYERALPDGGEILTREEYEAQFDRANGPAAERALLAHDAALRAEAGRLDEAFRDAHRAINEWMEKCDTATRALRRLNEFLTDAPGAIRDLDHAKGTLFHARNIAAAALAQIEGKGEK